MAVAKKIIIVFLSICFFEGGLCQEFHFPNPIIYEPSCGLENLQGQWMVQGKVKLTTHDVFVRDPTVIIQTNHQLCTIDLSHCTNTTPPTTVDVCYCTDHSDREFSIFVRRRARVSESGLMLQADMPSRDIFNPENVTSNIGMLPRVYDNVKTTYQVDDLKSQSLLTVQNVTVEEGKQVALTFCAADVTQGAVLSVTSGGQDTTTSNACVTMTRKYEFDKESVHQVLFKYTETGGCARSQTFTVYVREHPHTEGIIRNKQCLPQTDYVPLNLAMDVCRPRHDSCPRELITIATGKQLVCDTESDGGGFVVIQRRSSADIDFYQNWDTYRDGFGDLTGNFWYGLENVYRMCNKTNCELRIELKYKNKSYYADYKNFAISGESDNYRLNVSGYSGTAGDSLDYHNHMNFTTYDRDNDLYPGNCAVLDHGAWWYNHCASSNFNTLWNSSGHTSLRWNTLTGADSVSYTEMKVRRSV